MSHWRLHRPSTRGCPSEAASFLSVASDAAWTVVWLEPPEDEGAAGDVAWDGGEDDPDVAARITPTAIAAPTSTTTTSTIGLLRTRAIAMTWLFTLESYPSDVTVWGGMQARSWAPPVMPLQRQPARRDLVRCARAIKA